MSDWSGLVGVVVGSLLTGGIQVYRDWYATHREDKLRETRKGILVSLLADEKHSWRKIETLSRVIGCSEEKTCELLIECGARGSASESNVWGLITKHPLEKVER